MFLESGAEDGCCGWSWVKINIAHHHEKLDVLLEAMLVEAHERGVGPTHGACVLVEFLCVGRHSFSLAELLHYWFPLEDFVQLWLRPGCCVILHKQDGKSHFSGIGGELLEVGDSMEAIWPKNPSAVVPRVPSNGWGLASCMGLEAGVRAGFGLSLSESLLRGQPLGKFLAHHTHQLNRSWMRGSGWLQKAPWGWQRRVAGFLKGERERLGLGWRGRGVKERDQQQMSGEGTGRRDRVEESGWKRTEGRVVEGEYEQAAGKLLASEFRTCPTFFRNLMCLDSITLLYGVTVLYDLKATLKPTGLPPLPFESNFLPLILFMFKLTTGIPTGLSKLSGKATKLQYPVPEALLDTGRFESGSNGFHNGSISTFGSTIVFRLVWTVSNPFFWTRHLCATEENLQVNPSGCQPL
ncbi:hypothetical protein VP01_4045g1 [Puccinia sorghi]|uniref:Uncharacterized protein n=1 Tax=Puccinia sorghi TaxID=27349 RepID=A0A0L6URN3_9BASI|nr:hypothetical protein VP01_4045g1 [Puccinia sorghi]